jgi:hypothetical protein
VSAILHLSVFAGQITQKAASVNKLIASVRLPPTFAMQISLRFIADANLKHDIPHTMHRITMRKGRKISQAKINILKYSRQLEQALLVNMKEEHSASFRFLLTSVNV